MSYLLTAEPIIYSMWIVQACAAATCPVCDNHQLASVVRFFLQYEVYH